MTTSRSHRVVWLRIALSVAAALVLIGLGLLSTSFVLWGVGVDYASKTAVVLQASVAAASLIGTGALVGVTAYYAWITAEILRRAEPEITVELRQAWTDGVGVVTAPINTPDAFGPTQGYTKPMFAVIVRNSGGSPATVDNAAVDLPDGFAYTVAMPSVGPHWPHRLESQSSVTFFIDGAPSALIEIAHLGSVDARVRATCSLGSGEARHSVWTKLTAN